MGKFSKEQLGKLAKDFFKDGVTVVYAATDGQFFYDAARRDQHCEKRKLTPHDFYKDARKNADAPMTVNDLKAKIAEISDKEELETMLEAEKALDAPRTGAIKAIEEQIAKITA